MVLLEEVTNEEKTSKTGKPYTYTRIKVGGKYYSGFGGMTTVGWRAGMTAECKLYQEEYQGKMYDKFKVIGTIEKLEIRIVELEKAMKAVAKSLRTLEKANVPSGIGRINDIPHDLPFD